MNYVKRLINSAIFSYIISYIIFFINNSIFGNPFEKCFEISYYLFLDILIGWIGYFFIMDIYSKRWRKTIPHSTNIKQIWLPLDYELTKNEWKTAENLISPTSTNNQEQFKNFNEKWKKKGIFCELIFSSDIDLKKKNDKNKEKELIIFCHGLNKSSQKIRYITCAFAILGYDVLTYDARGMGKSIHLGAKRSFLRRNSDLDKIIRFFINHKLYGQYKIHLIGESMGGIAIINVLFKNKMELLRKIDRIAVISIPSVFNQIFRRHLIPFSRKWTMRLNYNLKGIKVYPPESINRKLSPYLIFKKSKDELNDESENKKLEWSEMIHKKLLLIHSMTDSLIKVIHFKQNKKMLELKESNSILFKDGGHSQLKNEPAIISAIDEFFNRN